MTKPSPAEFDEYAKENAMFSFGEGDHFVLIGDGTNEGVCVAKKAEHTLETMFKEALRRYERKVNEKIA